VISSPLSLKKHIKEHKEWFDWIPYLDLCIIGLFFTINSPLLTIPSGVGIDLPSTKTQSYANLPAVAVLTIKNNSMILFQGEKLTLEELEVKLEKFLKNKNTKNGILLLRAHYNVTVQELLNICDLARRAGLNIQIATEHKQ
jgi:biopolymer transport protein ExbD